jgi:hypothetical protein
MLSFFAQPHTQFIGGSIQGLCQMSTEITFWLIRHIPTGHYLPQPQGRMGRGGSHVEPVQHNPNDPATKPRLFTTKRSASNALGQWLAGKHMCHWSYGGEGYDYDEYTTIEPQPHRIRADMEIVSVNLVIP